MVDETSTLQPPPIKLGEKTLDRQVRSAPIEVPVSNGLPSRMSGFVEKAKNSVSTWGFVDQGIVSIASFAAAAIVGRTCGTVELGIYSLAVKIFWLAAGIPNALVWMPYTARAPRLPKTRRQFYLGSATIHMLLIAATMAVALLLVGGVPWPGLSEKSWLLPMCLALIPFSVLMMLKEHLRRVLLAGMETSSLLRVDVPIAICQLVVLAVLAWTQQLSATTALVGMAFACSWAIVWGVRNRDRFRLERRRVESHWGHNFQFGKWLLVVSVAWLIGEASYYWLVEGFHGLTAMGQFSAAAITVTFFNPVLLTVQNLARSILSNGYAQGGAEVLWNKTVQGTKAIGLGFGVLFAALATCGGSLVHLIFGDEFAGLGFIVASLCLGMYFHVLCSPVEAALTALQDGRSMLIASLIRLGMILLAGIPLIAVYGPIGVGFAMSLGAVSACIYQWYLFAERGQHARG